ncbi:hypothetical protein AC578_9993 [Pseudocercospora eumusae]|uniref:PIPK domain-containing protein n=1 Tax=Pseudocercospora eumusae TaxID=321146 RepID=A0A139HMF6_9PEZI|nr:hypothetical protein AC578_9993 [Pseudocercospora eumusae]
MARRQNVIARSVTHSILHSDARRPSVFARIPNFFWLYWLAFQCVREDLFKHLRGIWHIEEDDYKSSFGKDDNKKRDLKPMGDMGYSGSTFFTTSDSSYIVKSIPRHFEHSFFKNDLLLPYAEYMHNNPSSLLTRITDFLECSQVSIGTICGLAPSHHIVMENLLYGKEDSWEDYDLKPQSYFYPERDVAGGVLTSEATKSKLADDYKEKIVLTLDEAEDLKGQLEKDTKLLADCNAVDYSLMLVRIPASEAPDQEELPAASSTPLVPPAPPSWRTGIESADGKWVYRAAILDFFWAKHKVHAKAMTGLINTYNAVDRQGPMSVTTDSPEYRTRFLKMVEDMLERR